MAQVKTKKEIANIKKACQITDAIFTLILKQDLKNMTEVMLRDFILAEIKKRGLRPSFKPIVTSGPHAGNEIHPFDPKNKKLSGFVIIDFGVVYEKYMSDMTRTIFVGVPTPEDEMLYDIILRGELLGIVNAKAGISSASVDDIVRTSLGKYKKYFIHMLGHGVGTRIHENPRLFYKLTKPVLKENMVITIEPGIYIKNKLGIRIEDTCLVTKKGCVPLTKSPKELIFIK
ncbi:MAG: M24 family metallopeptidase [Patescibacteria group bacterium]